MKKRQRLVLCKYICTPVAIVTGLACNVSTSDPEAISPRSDARAARGDASSLEEEIEDGSVPETSVGETSDAETGVVQTNDAETSVAQTSDAETSDAETGDAETSDAETGDAETGVAETNDAETSDAETSDAGKSNPHVSAELAKAAFWSAFTEERYEEAAHITTQLEAALAVAPNDAELSLLVAHSYLWRLSEFARGESPDPAEVPSLSMAVQAAFERARAQAPEDSRILGWLGAVLVGNGKVSGQNEAIDAGLALVAEGVELNVEFNGFVSSLVHSAAPADSPEFALSQSMMWNSVEACAGFAVDREHPDLEAVVEAVYDPAVPQVCRSGPKAAHGLEGFLLYFGDLLLKANQPTVAAAMYAATKHVPTYDQWPYRSLVDQREQTLEQRLAAYANTDPSDDPVLVTNEPYACSFCHAATNGR